MASFMAKRILQVVPVLLGISVLVFLMLHLIPGDPARTMVGIEASQEIIEKTRHELGLDKPLHVQFLVFMEHLFQGDLGISIRTGIPVTQEIRNRYPITLRIAAGGTLVAALFGMLAGILAAVNQNKWPDNLIMIVSLLAVSTPSYWLALMLMLVFALQLGWLPTIGISTPLHYVLPIVTLGAQSMGIVSRMTRSAMLDVLRQDYIRTARSKGLPRRMVVFSHALRNALIPVVTILGLRFGGLLAGTVLVESVFAVPGIGRLMVDGILQRDYPVVQGTVLVIALSFVFVNLVVDLFYGIIDPRIRVH